MLTSCAEKSSQSEQVLESRVRTDRQTQTDTQTDPTALPLPSFSGSEGNNIYNTKIDEFVHQISPKPLPLES